MDINSFALGYSAGKKKGGNGTPEGFHMVRFFNDDRTTLLYTVFVPTGANAIYAGETPVATENETLIFKGFEPYPTNIAADLDTYAVYDDIGTLDQTTWARIAEASADGTAQNYFAVGDIKMIHVEGTVGTLEVNGDYGVYILGFDHNEKWEGKGIHFGTFKSKSGVDLALDDGNYSKSSTDGSKYFNMNHWGNYNYGGWQGCDLRYDVLGSTDQSPSGYGSEPTSSRVGYDASESCAVNPQANTLMAALPSDLRAVMKPMTKYADARGNASTHSNYVIASIDYLPLLAEFEIMSKSSYGNPYEVDKQKRYDYYSAGNSRVKYRQSLHDSTAICTTRTASSKDNGNFVTIYTSGNASMNSAFVSYGLAPIFKV